MSLTARIPLHPSRRIGAMELAMPLGGIAATVTTAMQRWPSAAIAWVAIGGLAGVALMVSAVIRRRRSRPWSIAVADRAEIDVWTDASPTSRSCRLAESTLSWPAFAVVALEAAGPQGGVMRRAVLVADLAAADRWTLRRFLAWSLRTRGERAGLDQTRTP